MSTPKPVPSNWKGQGIAGSPPKTMGFAPDSFVQSPKLLYEKDSRVLKQLANQEKTKVLLLEGVNRTGIELFEKQGYEIETFAKALPAAELKEKIKDVHIVGLRSKTTLTEDILKEAKNLVAIGCFCIGTNQVDLNFAQSKGIPVFNSPFSNSRSVAELVLGEIIALARQVVDQNDLLHKGIWKRPPIEKCSEIRGKTLGIVGYGHIGSQLSVLADSMGMKVIYYDVIPIMPLGTASQLATLEDLLMEADFVSLHVPATPQTKNMIGEEQLQMMKKGSFLINNARGTVVDIGALRKSLEKGHLGGAAVDVFPKEPGGNGGGFETGLVGCPNTILTPHIGGSTEEAQRAIGVEVASALIRYIKTGSSLASVNFPVVELKNPSPDPHIVRILTVYEQGPGVLRQINKIISVFNIISQASVSEGKISYMSADLTINGQEDMKVLEQVQEDLRKMPEEIRTRILY